MHVVLVVAVFSVAALLGQAAALPHNGTTSRRAFVSRPVSASSHSRLPQEPTILAYWPFYRNQACDSALAHWCEHCRCTARRRCRRRRERAA